MTQAKPTAEEHVASLQDAIAAANADYLTATAEARDQLALTIEVYRAAEVKRLIAPLDAALQERAKAARDQLTDAQAEHDKAHKAAAGVRTKAINQAG